MHRDLLSLLTFLNGDSFELISLLYLVYHILTLRDLPKNSVFTIQPIRCDVGDEELAAVGVGAGVGHGERADLVFAGVVAGFVLETVPGTAAAGRGGVAALNHEVGDDAMKDGAVVEAVASQENEIVDGLGGVLGEQFADDA